MAIFRQYIAPLLVVLLFLIALVAVSARIFLPADMAAPAPVEENGEMGRRLLTERIISSCLSLLLQFLLPQSKIQNRMTCGTATRLLYPAWLQSRPGIAC